MNGSFFPLVPLIWFDPDSRCSRAISYTRRRKCIRMIVTITRATADAEVGMNVWFPKSNIVYNCADSAQGTHWHCLAGYVYTLLWLRLSFTYLLYNTMLTLTALRAKPLHSTTHMQKERESLSLSHSSSQVFLSLKRCRMVGLP